MEKSTLPEKSELEIRLAQAGDEAEIANIHLNSWREAYRGLLLQDFLDQLLICFKTGAKFSEEIKEDIIGGKPAKQLCYIWESIKDFS